MPEPVTVADHLALDVDAASSLPPYILGGERDLRRTERAPRLRPHQLDALLLPYGPDIAAGVPDSAIARRAGVTRGMVKHWRRHHHIPGRKGKPPDRLVAGFLARSLISKATGPVVAHETVSLRGEWSPPEYVLRRPLHYDVFVDLVALLADAGMELSVIADGLGIVERDVGMALQIHARSAG